MCGQAAVSSMGAIFAALRSARPFPMPPSMQSCTMMMGHFVVFIEL